MTNTIAQTAVGLERIQTILSADDVIPEKAGRDRRRRSSRARSRSSTSRSATTRTRPVLKDVSFTVKPGQVIGVVGGTGSGKSTIVSLIPRFYDPTGGPRADRRHRRARLRAAPAAPADRLRAAGDGALPRHASATTSRTAGRATRPTTEIVAAAKLANADEFIAKMPQGYDTIVGERGDTLSGGQRQRIGIARAVIRDNPILILDEPTAALDTESERLVMEGLERLMKGRTVITHRAPPVDDPRRRQHHRAGQRRGRRAGHARRSSSPGTASTPTCTMCSSATTARPRRPPPLTSSDPPCPARSSSFPKPPQSRCSTPSAARRSRCASRCSCSPIRGLLDAVIAARKRGIDVRVMLNPARRSGETENEDSRRKLVEARRLGARQQSRVRPHAREVDGRRRRARRS